MIDIADIIVEDIIFDLTDRSGLGNAFEECDPDIQDEIKESWSNIVSKHLASWQE